MSDPIDQDDLDKALAMLAPITAEQALERELDAEPVGIAGHIFASGGPIPDADNGPGFWKQFALPFQSEAKTVVVVESGSGLGSKIAKVLLETVPRPQVLLVENPELRPFRPYSRLRMGVANAIATLAAERHLSYPVVAKTPDGLLDKPPALPIPNMPFSSGSSNRRSRRKAKRQKR